MYINYLFAFLSANRFSHLFFKKRRRGEFLGSSFTAPPQGMVIGA
jgi:hypothetical protein